VVIELTEGTLLAGAEVDQRIAELHEIGVRFAIDDFGVGYSSLSYLARLPVDIVKIDRSFVAAMRPDQDALIAAVVQLARSLEIKTIAEGVEEPWQVERLAELGCDGAQGYALGRPGAPPVAGLTADAPRGTTEPPPPPPPARAAAG
jgi:EAL domain-containing protein (putative c-di-GMP-specific phosphodiesterase class I)